MFCGKVKEFLSQNKIEYTERNIVADETALAELEKLGYLTTPVTVIDGEMVVGFGPRQAGESSPGELRVLPAAHEQRERARWLTDERSLRLTDVRKAVCLVWLCRARVDRPAHIRPGVLARTN